MQSNEKTNVMDIRTPEGVFFPIQLAGPVTRCSAWLIDLACILGIQNIIMHQRRHVDHLDHRRQRDVLKI